MSTRSMTIIAQPYDKPGAFVPLYRHCDGYPAEAGKAIVDALSAQPLPTCPEDILARLLALRYKGGEVAQDGTEPVYRAATWLPEAQGDLEHVYEVSMPATGWTIKHYRRHGWDVSAHGSDVYSRWPATVYTLPEFALFVERQAKEIEKRIAARQQRA